MFAAQVPPQQAPQIHQPPLEMPRLFPGKWRGGGNPDDGARWRHHADSAGAGSDRDCAGRLFDSNTGRMLVNQVVITSAERIVAVGPQDQVKIPDGRKFIDFSQATVLPGLIDWRIRTCSTVVDAKQARRPPC